MDRILDWVSRHDERSKDFPMRAVMAEAVPKVRKVWKEGTVLDQGSEGACVGFGWTGELLAEPAAPKPQPNQRLGNKYALDVYHNAQKIDEWEGENYSGTSVLAGAKVLKGRNAIGNYRWCFGIDDVRDAIITSGPVVIGVPWYDKMYSTNSNGLVKVGGNKVGGHCILLTAYDPSLYIEGKRQEVFRWRNSWGKDYGLAGSAFIKAGDLAELLSDGGEACVPMDRQIVKFN